MNVIMMGMFSKKVELQFEVSVDKSQRSFTEHVSAIRQRKANKMNDWVKQAEIEEIIEAMDNSGIFDDHPHCIVIIT